MKKRMLAFLTVCAVLCGSACARSVPSGIERGTPETESPEESETQTPGKELLPVYAPERIAAASKWDGNQQMVTSESEIYDFLNGNGNGKKETPYLLKSAEDVARLAANVRFYGTYLNTENTRYRGVYFRLECDIDMQGHPWWGIGGGSESSRGKTSFMGIFDGNNHAIYNLALQEEPLSGFFSYISDGAVIKNLIIASGTVELSSKFQYAGILVGRIASGAVIENCSVSVEMTGSSEKLWTVGIIGYETDYPVTRENCDFSGVTFGGEPYAIPEIGYKRTTDAD